MNKIFATVVAAGVLIALWSAPGASAQTATPSSQDMSMSEMHMAMHAPQQLSVTASGTVEYTPDTARLMLGIRSESPSAATAVDTINKNAASVIAAVEGLGISQSQIKTIGYNLQYRERPNQGQTAAVAATATAAQGSYEASEILAVTAPVGLAGKVLDAAIGAGANESFGLTYQTTKYDDLYREALAKAVTSARATADALARAAHVSIVDILSISNTSEASSPMFRPMATAMASASVLPGTDEVSATVYVVYRIK